MPLDPARLARWRRSPRIRRYGPRDVMMYALALGLGADATDRRQLRFVTEPELEALPTLAAVLAFDDDWIAGVGISFSDVLHGEQRIAFDRPLPTAGEIRIEGGIRAVHDKGKHALVILDSALWDDERNQRLATLESTVFIRGQGGFGGPPGGPTPLPAVPQRAPDATLVRTTEPRQALLYRLGGDYNRMHFDPAFARAAGFERPILHGLCTYGIAAHALAEACADGEPSRLASISCRFTAPVLPGDTLTVEVWRGVDGKHQFQTRVYARNQTVLSNGVVEFRP